MISHAHTPCSFFPSRGHWIILLGLALAGLCENASGATKQVPVKSWKPALRASGLVSSSASLSAATGSNPYLKLTQAQYKILALRLPALSGSVPIPLATARLLSLLNARRNLNPTRFDQYHPVIGRMLAAQNLLKTPVACDNPQIAAALLPDTPFYDYFRERRALDPVRFDSYHPQLGALLALDQQIRDDIPVCQILNPPPIAQTVPEPGPIALMALAGLVMAGRRKVAGSWFFGRPERSA